MKAIAVKEYGAIYNLVSLETEKPDAPQGHDILVRYATFFTKIPDKANKHKRFSDVY